MAWRLASSLSGLRDEINAKYPKRSKVSDGTIGDAAHSSRTSEHNPNSAGVVRAMDITVSANGVDPLGSWYAEHIRQLGAAGHPALKNHGYVIFNRRAAYATNGWKWVRYTGSNPHDKHVHVSVGRDPAQYDSRQTWAIRAAQIGLDTATNHSLELTMGQYEEIMDALGGIRSDIWKTKAQLDQVSEAVYGSTDESKDKSILWNSIYLRGELLGGENAGRLREILKQYGEPKAIVAIVAEKD